MQIMNLEMMINDVETMNFKQLKSFVNQYKNDIRLTIHTMKELVKLYNSKIKCKNYRSVLLFILHYELDTLLCDQKRYIKYLKYDESKDGKLIRIWEKFIKTLFSKKIRNLDDLDRRVLTLQRYYNHAKELNILE